MWLLSCNLGTKSCDLSTEACLGLLQCGGQLDTHMVATFFKSLYYGKQKEAALSFMSSPPKSRYYFHHSSIHQNVLKPYANTRGRGIGLPSQWEVDQCYIIKRICEMGHIVVDILENTSCHIIIQWFLKGHPDVKYHSLCLTGYINF